MLEASWPLHHVQRMLGHADVKQTATYLNAERVGLHESMKRSGLRHRGNPWQTRPRRSNRLLATPPLTLRRKRLSQRAR
jgi:hypothetical protein